MNLPNIIKKMKNKNEILCKNIIENISKINKKPIKTEIDNTSFKLIYNYANAQFEIEGNNINDNNKKEIRISYNDYWISLRKNNCTLKNITDIIITIFRKDNLPRCKKCGSRPQYYLEYNYEIQEIETDENSLPVFGNIYIPYVSEEKNSVENIKPKSFVIAECSCGNQWRLRNFSSVFDIYNAYREADK